MAFELTDFFRSYVPRGDFRGLFNVARADEDGGTKYYAYQNEGGSYAIQRITTSGTLKIYEYYAVGKKASTTFASDWTNRAGLSYVEYYQLFPEI